MTTLSDQEYKEIRDRADRASRGPWVQTHDVNLGVKIWDADGRPLVANVSGLARSKISEADPIPQWQRDVDFIRHARADVPRLLDAIAAIRAENKRLLSEVRTGRARQETE